ncbi:hypothetical protein IMZ31_22795 (plasmid) [Pontibacillus sp. ALD_SL1]|uniref:hypothetical protein n=1 Tax=Pontibacillus sp. ALD_SL1 TaxID=2777185 RepID=UPI001A96176E|nr:hypothetical protein [Pontibacillus sp. ALD_SL1]QST02285.1 hypothetical protein IMZ31_22795 [Pontibacillus sp. ALD_SL1]
MKKLMFFLISLLVLAPGVIHAAYDFGNDTDATAGMCTGNTTSTIDVQGIISYYNIKEKNKAGKLLDRDLLAERGLVVYGTPRSGPSYTLRCHQPELKHLTFRTHRILGYTYDNREFQDPFFPDDYTGRSDYLNNNPVFLEPWKNSAIVNKGKWSPSFPEPKAPNLTSKDLGYLRNVVAGGKGKKSKYICKRTGVTDPGANHIYVQYNEDDNRKDDIPCWSNYEPADVTEPNVLEHFISNYTRPKDYTPGVFDVYVNTWPCIGKMCYKTFFIPPLKKPVEQQDKDVSVDYQIDKKTYKPNEEITMQISMTSDYKGIKVDSRCGKHPGNAECRSGISSDKEVFSYKFVSEGGTVIEKLYSFSNLKPGQTATRSVTKDKVVLPEKGNWTVTVQAPEYKDEVDYSNNRKTFTITVDAVENAKVEVTGGDIFQDGEEVDAVVSVTNNMLNPINGNLEIVFLDETNTIVQTINRSYTAIGPGKTSSYNIADDNIVLGTNTNYVIRATIDRYPGETDYGVPIDSSDNRDTHNISYLPFTPDNLECKDLGVDYTKVVGGPNIGLTKLCLGTVPKYPSTIVERGQGSYFFIDYKLFPMPFPAYEITNLDDKGFRQQLSFKEPTDKLGACEPGTADTECREIDSFLYYPKDHSNVSGLKGPYTAGPHDDFHYMYRGRMMPKTITFDFTITDPNGQIVEDKNKAAKGIGTVVFEVDPDKCYREDMIEVEEKCRNIMLYIPKTVKSSSAKPVKVPEQLHKAWKVPDEEDRFQFLNPGIHTFQLKVSEEQVYYYQFDEGHETQGQKGTMTEIGEGPVSTHQVTYGTGPGGSNEWIIQDDFLNYCGSEEDAFGQTGEWKGTTFDEKDAPDNYCVHRHDQDWHYWTYKWSDPINYGFIEN